MKYQIHKDIMNNDQRRAAFNRLSTEIFKLSFENWYQSGYWSERNLPYVLFDGERAISSISVNRVEVLWEGSVYQMIQLGTVMTDKEYRNQGLSRILMESVLDEWQEKCEVFFLFANRKVLDFYPRFGFQKCSQYSYSMLFEAQEANAVKLDMDSAEDWAVLKSCYQKGNPFSRLQEIDNFGLLMFYCMASMKNSVFYSESCKGIVIAGQKGTELHCYGIYCDHGYDLECILASVAAPGTERVVFHFTPSGNYRYCLSEVGADADTLFVRSQGATIFANNKLLFPELSHT